MWHTRVAGDGVNEFALTQLVRLRRNGWAASPHGRQCLFS